MHIGGIEHEVREIRSTISKKVDQHEIHTLRSNVDNLERTVRELRAEVDGLRQQLSYVEENVIGLSLN